MNLAKGSVGLCALGAFVWLVTSASGCTPRVTPEKLCEKACECDPTPCENDECVTFFDGQEKLADDSGCSAEFDTAIRCYYNELECVDGQVQVESCEDEISDFNICVNGSPGEPT